LDFEKCDSVFQDLLDGSGLLVLRRPWTGVMEEIMKKKNLIKEDSSR